MRSADQSGEALPRMFVLTGATVVAGEGLDVMERGYVVVRNGRIAEVGEGPGPDGLVSFDLTGRVVVPGFVNCHTHIEDAGLKELGFGIPQGTNLLFEPDGLRHRRMAEQGPSEVFHAVRDAARQMIASGTVAFGDYRTRGAEGAALVRDACADLPLRAIVFGGHTQFPIQSDEALKANQGMLTVEQIADIEETLSVADGFAPVRVNDTTDEALRQISDVVRRAGKRLSTHSGASPDYRALSLERTGNSDIDRAIDILKPDFVVHMTVATDSEIGQMVEAGIPMVMCPRAMAALGRPIPPFISATTKGGIVSLGTDNVMTSSPDLLAESDFLARSIRSVSSDPGVVDARAILRALTVDAARTLGLDDLGWLGPNQSATLVVIDFRRPSLTRSVNPIASVVSRAEAADIEAVLIDGVLVHGVLRADDSRPE